MNKILIFVIALTVIYVSVFFIPDNVERFALIPEKKIGRASVGKECRARWSR